MHSVAKDVQGCEEGQVTFALSIVKARMFVRGFSAGDIGKEAVGEPLSTVFWMHDPVAMY